MDFARIQSPSSINTFFQCPRKYFYQYIEKLDTFPSIHLVRGRIAHSVLEDFFKLNIEAVSTENYDFEFKIILHELLSKHWTKSQAEIAGLGMSNYEVDFYLNETKQMIQFWVLDFLKKLKIEMDSKNLIDAFRFLTPKTEMYLCSEEHGVRGYIDAIFTCNEVKIIDYKTSKRDHITDAYRLQLAIYAMLYDEKYGKLPDKVGIHFLKFCEKVMDVDKDMVDYAKREVAFIHENTQSKELCDYPKKESPLCRWRTGQCDFYDKCRKKS